MLFTTLASVVVGFLGAVATANDYGSSPSPSITKCETITTLATGCPALPTDCPTFSCVTTLAVTQHCGCNSIYTTEACQTGCPDCGVTSYMVAIEDCFPTSPPPYVTTTTSTPPPYYPPTTTPAPPGYQNSTYTNTKTKTNTETEITTVTSCPAYTTCTGQTVTYTSTELCPDTTCTCVLPSETHASNLPIPVTSTPAEVVPSTTADEPKPTAESTTTYVAIETTAKPTFIEANGAVGRWNVEMGFGLVGGLLLAVMVGL